MTAVQSDIDELGRLAPAETSPPAKPLVELLRPDRRSRSRVSVPRGLRRLSGPATLVAAWWLLSAAGVLGPETFPPPTDVLPAGWELLRSGELAGHLWASLSRVLVGLVIGVGVGLFVAVLAGLTRRMEDFLDSIMQILKAIPNFSLIPLLIIWFGIDETPKITLVALATMMPIYMNTYGAIRNVDQKLVETAHTLELGRFGLVRHVVMPGSIPGFLVGLRISLTNAWLALIFAETINAQQGLGRLMSDARSFFSLDIMVFVILIYAVLGLLTYSFVRFLERNLLAWRRGFEGT